MAVCRTTVRPDSAEQLRVVGFLLDDDDHVVVAMRRGVGGKREGEESDDQWAHDFRLKKAGFARHPPAPLSQPTEWSRQSGKPGKLFDSPSLLLQKCILNEAHSASEMTEL